MSPRWSWAGPLRALTRAEGPNLVAVQGSLLLFVLCDLLTRGLAGEGLALGSWPGLGVALLVGVTAAAAGLTGRELPVWAPAVIAGVDLLGLGLVRTTPGGTAAGILVVLPAVWLGHRYGRRAAAPFGFAVLVLASGPSFLANGPAAVEVSRALLIAVVAAWCTGAMAVGVERLSRQRDTAERHGAELADAMATIEHQRRVSEAILETVDVGLVLLDADGRYASMNRRHQDFIRLAYPGGHGGMAGQEGVVFDSDAVTPLRREDLPTHRASQGEEFDDCRIWVGDDPLTRRALSVSARTVHDSAGRFAGAALAYTDVTDFMRALQVKDEFVAAVSHELRTPLTSILGYLQLVRDHEDLAEVTDRHLQVVQRNAERLLRLVGDLLQTAQAEGRGVQISRADVDLADVVRQAVDAARPRADEAGVALSSDVPAQLWARVDEQRVAQVVDNLLSNAVKYTPAGGEVRVRLVVEGSRVELEVADTGIGIAPAERNRLFQRFYRTREAEARSIPGLGLGLNITRSIVESHGGRIELDSEPGRGTRVRVRLPRE